MAKTVAARGDGTLHHEEPLLAHLRGALDAQTRAELRAHVNMNGIPNSWALHKLNDDDLKVEYRWFAGRYTLAVF